MKKLFAVYSLLLCTFVTFAQVEDAILEETVSIDTEICPIFGRSDLFMRDDIDDCGEEPNVTTTRTWVSPDIWLEDLGGNIVSDLNAGQTYNFCVRITNRGDCSSYGDETIHLHWSKASIGGAWPNSWFASSSIRCGETDIVVGEEISPEEGFVLPIIPAGQTVLLRYPMTAPNPADYESCDFFEDNPTERTHYCILARIEEPFYGELTDMTPQSIKTIVLDYNNVVSRNIGINWSDDGFAPSEETIQLFALSDHVNLECRIEPEFWDGVYQIFLYVDSYLEQVVDNVNVYGMYEYANGKYEVLATHFGATDLFVDPFTMYGIRVELVPLINFYDKVEIELLQKDFATGETLDGYTIIFDYRGVGYPSRIAPKKSVVEHSEISVFSINGILLYTGEELDIESLTQGIYLIQESKNGKQSISKIIK